MKLVDFDWSSGVGFWVVGLFSVPIKRNYGENETYPILPLLFGSSFLSSLSLIFATVLGTQNVWKSLQHLNQAKAEAEEGRPSYVRALA